MGGVTTLDGFAPGSAAAGGRGASLGAGASAAGAGGAGASAAGGGGAGAAEAAAAVSVRRWGAARAQPRAAAESVRCGRPAQPGPRLRGGGAAGRRCHSSGRPGWVARPADGAGRRATRGLGGGRGGGAEAASACSVQRGRAPVRQGRAPGLVGGRRGRAPAPRRGGGLRRRGLLGGDRLRLRFGGGRGRRGLRLRLADQAFTLGLTANAVGLRLHDARGVALDADPQTVAEVDCLFVAEAQLASEFVHPDLACQESSFRLASWSEDLSVTWSLRRA